MRTDQQHNVTLENSETVDEAFLGKPFSCPVCGAAIPLKMSRRQKPYCTCLECGIQIFFRGKSGIERLRQLLASEKAIDSEFSGASRAVGLYNRIQQLKRRKAAYSDRQGLVFRDADLDRVMVALDTEIERLQSALENANQESEGRK